MKPRIDLRFRPSLIIFVDDAGERICQHFKHIIQMTQFDEIVQQCIALLQITTGDGQIAPDEELDASFFKAIPIPVVGEQFPEFDPDLPTEPGDLDELLARSISSVRLDRRLIEVNDAGYPVPNPRPQIYIVGDARSASLRAVHQVVREQLRRRGFTTLVCYVLDAYEASATGAPHLGGDPLLDQQSTSYWLQHDVPDFCYFYEDQLTYPVPRTVTQAESHYAAAESLFALIAAGITPEPIFEQFMKLDSNLTSYTNVGSLGTTLIIFPNEAALEFCSARLGRTLLQQWLNDINRELLPENERRKLQDRARGDVEQMRQWIVDLPPRPYANETEQTARHKGKKNEESERVHRWPSLDILTQDNHPISARALTQQRGLHFDVRNHTQVLFKLFQYADVEGEARGSRKRPDAWTRLVYHRSGRAVDVYQEWDQVASQAWDAAGQRIGVEVKQTVDTLWSRRGYGIYGFEMAKTYVEAFDEHLTKLQDRLIRMREMHERGYEERLDEFERLADGEWLPPQGAANINTQVAAGVTQVGPGIQGAANAQAGNGANALVNAGGGNAPARSTTHQHLTAHEEDIARNLELRIAWLQEQVPSIPTQVAISLPIILAAVLAGQALYPQGNLFYTLLLTVVSVTVIGIMNWLFWRRYQKRVEEGRKDLLRFYRAHFAHRCEQREDALRRLVMVPLKRRVLSMRERLDDIALFIESVQDELDERSQRVRRHLFSSPSGVRDIYIANGERLQKQRRNTIEDFEGQVTRQRENSPVEEWHRTLQDMRERLIETFHTDTQSIIEMTAELAREHIYEFTSKITAPYLHGPLSDIQRALDNNDIWKDALDRARSPLYQAQVGIREPQLLFVCGRGVDLAHGEKHWPTNTTPVLISDHHHWVLIAALFRGGSPPAFDPDTLFPDKHAPTRDTVEIEDIGDISVSVTSLLGEVLDEANSSASAEPTTFPPGEVYDGVKGGASEYPATFPSVDIPGDENNLLKLAEKFKRYEQHLAYYTSAETPHPGTAIGDRDLDLPIPFRLTEIQADKNALSTFINKHLTEYRTSVGRLAADPVNSLHAFDASWRCFAVRTGQRMLGLPAQEMLQWPELLQWLLSQTQHPDLQRLVKEDMTLAPSTIAEVSSTPDSSAVLAPVRGKMSPNESDGDTPTDPSIRRPDDLDDEDLTVRKPAFRKGRAQRLALPPDLADLLDSDKEP